MRFKKGQMVYLTRPELCKVNKFDAYKLQAYGINTKHLYRVRQVYPEHSTFGNLVEVELPGGCIYVQEACCSEKIIKRNLPKWF